MGIISKLKLRSKFMIACCGLIVIMYGVTVVLISRMANSNARIEAAEKTEYLASHYRHLIKNKIETAMLSARTIAQTYEGRILEAPVC